MSSAASRQPVRAVVCIPTFRRPVFLLKTLRSVADQAAGFAFAVVVVENDAVNRQGEAAARLFLDEESLEGCVEVEHDQGNCHAINRAFRTARTRYPEAEFFLMIDDDETAQPGWLAGMVGAAEASGADVVGGPVPREFETDAPEAIRRHPLFGSIEAATGFVPIIHGSGNCLIRRRVFEGLDNPDFDVRFNFLGGGDMDFFTRCRQKGFSFYWNAEAVVVEWVPRQRISARWLMHRSLFTGAINYTIDRRRRVSPLGAASVYLKNLCTLPLGLFRSARLLLRLGRLLPASHPFLMAVGRNMAGMGFAPAPYRAKTPPGGELGAPAKTAS